MKIYSPDSPLVRRTVPPIVEVRKDWADEWHPAPDLEPTEWAIQAAAEGISHCAFRRRYGYVKDTFETALATRSPRNLHRWWVRLRLASDQGLDTVFVGRFQASTRIIHSSDVYRSGVQTWTAYGPLRLLEKIAVSRSYWRVPEEELPGRVVELGWLPPMNDRDRRGDPVGNRYDDAEADGTYTYGGDETWTHRQYAEYLLARFVDESATGGPAWTLTGQPDLLEDLHQVINWGDTTTAAGILRGLINHQHGLDFFVRYREKADEDDDDETDGFEVVVFSLLPKDYEFQTRTLARNPNRVIIQVGDEPEVDCQLERSSDHEYGRLRVFGQRIVVCCTLWGEDAEVQAGLVDAADAEDFAGHASLVPRWSTDLLNEYLDGTGNVFHDAYEHDLARQRDHLRPVFRLFGAPNYWDLNAGQAAPFLDEVTNVDYEQTADYQRHTRTTLDWLPLYEGIDYSTYPETDNNPDGHHPDLLPPAAWIYDPYLQRYAPVEDLGLSLHIAQTEWGIWIDAKPAHALALNHWPGGSQPTSLDPVWDYDDLIATIAFRTDQRVEWVLEIDDHHASDGTLDVFVPEAEFWYLCPETVLGVKTDDDQDSQLITTGPLGGVRILRDDSPRLAEVALATLARYHSSRNKAVVTIRGYWPWSSLLGQILSAVEDQGDAQEVAAAITSVSWLANPPRTIIRTGYAL